MAEPASPSKLTSTISEKNTTTVSSPNLLPNSSDQDPLFISKFSLSQSTALEESNNGDASTPTTVSHALLGTLVSWLSFIGQRSWTLLSFVLCGLWQVIKLLARLCRATVRMVSWPGALQEPAGPSDSGTSLYEMQSHTKSSTTLEKASAEQTKLQALTESMPFDLEEAEALADALRSTVRLLRKRLDGLKQERDELQVSEKELFRDRERLKDQCRILEGEKAILEAQVQSSKSFNTSSKSFEEFLLHMAKTTYAELPWTDELAFKHFHAVLDQFEKATFSQVFPLTRRSIPWPDLGDPRQLLYGHYYPVKEVTFQSFFSKYRTHIDSADDRAYCNLLKRLRDVFRPEKWNTEMTLATASDPQPLIEAGVAIYKIINVELKEVSEVLAKEETLKISPNPLRFSRRISGQRMRQTS